MHLELWVGITINRSAPGRKPAAISLCPATYNAFMRRIAFSVRIAALVFTVCLTTIALAQNPLPTASAEDRALAREIFKQLIEINTTDTPLGNVTTATAAMQKRFLDAGFPPEDVHLLGPDMRKQNLVVRLRAAGTATQKPVLFLCHMDVVQALRSDWTTDPFQFVEKDGYYYGRGTQDMKNSDAALVATFLRLHREGYKPKRDLILALTADEEGGKFNGAEWLVRQHRELVDAAYVINPDSGGVELDHGRAVVADVEATEKVYSDYQITATNRGGHSSLPRPDNAIYELTAALNKLAAYTFPFEMNEVTRTYFTNLAEQETGQTAADMRAILATPPDLAAAARLERRAKLQRQLPHYLRGYAAQCRPRQQRASADCPGQRQLPHLSRPLARRDPAAVDRPLRRPEAEREVRIGLRRGYRHGA